MSGQGEVGPGGGPAGDLYVEIDVADHDFLVREGNDLHVSVSVPMTGAALGSKVKIETLDGEIEIEIKPGTQSGSVLPIRGKGITKLRGSGRGDLFAHIDVLIPNKLSKKEEDLLHQFAEARGDKANSGEVKQRHETGFFGKFHEAFRNRK
jgi:molecular chaperone DnaJ